MTYHQPTEVIGNSINAWDQFYQNHFDRVYKYTLQMCHNTLKAKELTDRMFVKLFFTDPGLVSENSEEVVESHLGILFPYIGVSPSQNKELSAGRLLHLYYQPN